MTASSEKTISKLGYVREANGNAYSRDIGRSFTLGGQIFYLFGDTFCKARNGEFVGLVSNTVARIPDPADPLTSEYLDIDDSGLVRPFLTLTEEEQRLEEQCFGQRVTLWPFGGVVETSPGQGLVWYQKGIEHKGSHHEYCGVGIASVAVSSQHITVRRLPGLAFDRNAPRIGSFSAFRHQEYVYLYGERGTEMLVARTDLSHASDPSEYAYWTADGWIQGALDKAIAIFDQLPQGQVFHDPILGGDETPFVLVGVSKWADSQIRLGTACNPQGPWVVCPVATAQGIDYANDYMYCIYPHPWASNDSGILVTWSEHWPGGVVAARMS